MEPEGFSFIIFLLRLSYSFCVYHIPFAFIIFLLRLSYSFCVFHIPFAFIIFLLRLSHSFCVYHIPFAFFIFLLRLSYSFCVFHIPFAFIIFLLRFSYSFCVYHIPACSFGTYFYPFLYGCMFCMFILYLWFTFGYSMKPCQVQSLNNVEQYDDVTEHVVSDTAGCLVVSIRQKN